MKHISRHFIFIGTVSCGLLMGAVQGRAQEKAPDIEPVSSAKSGDTNSDQVLRSYLQLQEQLHSALLAIEETKHQTDEAGKKNAEMIAARLTMIEQALTGQNKREADALRKTYRTSMIIAGVVGACGLLAVLLTIVFLFRAMKRLAQVASHLPSALTMGQTSVFTEGPAALPLGEMPSGRLLGALERLERRIQEMEAKALTSSSAGSNGHGAKQYRSEEHAHDMDPAAREQADQIALLLGKGQALLHMDRVEAAVECFDEVIAVDPRNAEALVKKGSALEKLKKLEEAILCYDQAIGINGSMTLAYLYKGGVFNQMERFSEALECYEQALRTQQKAVLS